MTTYSYTVTFDDSEAIWIESMVQKAIDKFKLEHADDGLPMPSFLESILKKMKGADMELMSKSHFSREEPAADIKTSNE